MDGDGGGDGDCEGFLAFVADFVVSLKGKIAGLY